MPVAGKDLEEDALDNQGRKNPNALAGGEMGVAEHKTQYYVSHDQKKVDMGHTCTLLTDSSRISELPQ